jgi:SAM-dependent methyltransferase
MKVRESGMPEEEMWQGFFDPDHVLSLLALPPKASSVVDFGCGYGTFTIPAAKRIQGVVHAFDIEPLMLEEAKKKANPLRLTNIQFHLRDFVSDGTGLADSSADYVMFSTSSTRKTPNGCCVKPIGFLPPMAKLGSCTGTMTQKLLAALLSKYVRVQKIAEDG